MLRAVFVRTLKPGVTYEQFKDAWVPEDIAESYPVKTRVSRNVSNDRQVMTILELDIPLTEFTEVSASLTRPDASSRLGEIVEATQLEGLNEDVFDERSLA
jgi:hypothetical protein